MERGIAAPLSPNEEVTLRRVALGIAARKDLREADLGRLARLGLIEERDGRVVLTDPGRHRYRELPKAADMSGVADPKAFLGVLKRDLDKGRA